MANQGNNPSNRVAFPDQDSIDNDTGSTRIFAPLDATSVLPPQTPASASSLRSPLASQQYVPATTVMSPASSAIPTYAQPDTAEYVNRAPQYPYSSYDDSTNQPSQDIPEFAQPVVQAQPLQVAIIGPTEQPRTLLYTVLCALITTAISAAYPFIALVIIGMITVIFSIRGSRIMQRMRNPQTSKLALFFAFPWHLAKGIFLAILYTLATAVMLLATSILSIAILRFTSFAFGFGNWTIIFELINTLALTLSWLTFLGRPQSRALRVGLRTKAQIPSRMTALIVVIALIIVGIILAFTSMTESVSWSPLPDIQSSLLSNIPSFT
ncbi:hypothetical protein EJ419_04355 [Alloscardovia theropitheci]|uniref:Uncharacterized protein n=1 Tax=Alloscardovia theropitheci TaxID=2496842 RepID=A0A4R0QZZ0_9BIFI|nr:hypothetical protein [Alloscardovia theropitheci]TCD54276.1 hypothetical protein EJ419_04355 [Alloscardovia theropitheci]